MHPYKWNLSLIAFILLKSRYTCSNFLKLQVEKSIRNKKQYNIDSFLTIADDNAIFYLGTVIIRVSSSHDQDSWHLSFSTIYCHLSVFS